MIMNSRLRKDQVRPTIVLLSDFGVDSFYVGAMKAAILRVTPDAVLVDLTHGIRPFAFEEASFVLARVLGLFAPGTVCLAVVDPGVGGKRDNLIFECEGRYIVAPDNGLVSDIADSFEIGPVHSINDDDVAKIRGHGSAGRTFLGRDVLGPAAGFLVGGGRPGDIGVRISEYKTFVPPRADIGTDHIRGVGRYVDSFGNIFTNISLSDLRSVFGDAPLAEIRGTVNTNIGIDGIDEFFAEGVKDALMLILNSWGIVEISVNQGRAIDRFPGMTAAAIELALTRRKPTRS